MIDVFLDLQVFQKGQIGLRPVRNPAPRKEWKKGEKGGKGGGGGRARMRERKRER